MNLDTLQEIHWSLHGAWQGGTVSSIVLSPDFANDGIAIAATSAGLFRTDSAAQHWALVMNGFSDPSVVALAVTKGQNHPLFFASSEQGRLFHSHDLGQSWAEMASWAGLGVGVTIALSPTFAEDKTLFVATSEGIFRTLDGGIAWQEASFGLLDLDVLCLTVAPDFAHSQMVWAGTALGGLFRTRNAGRAWREAGAGLPDCAVQCIALSPYFVQDQTIFVGVETGGVYRSSDGGLTWNLAGKELAELSVNSLAVFVQPSTPNSYVLFAATAAGIYSSKNQGEQWHDEASDLPVLDLAVAENSSGLAAVYQRGIYARTSNEGNWQAMAAGIVAHAPPLIVRGQHDQLFALDSDGELARSQDGGATWQAMMTVLGEFPLVALAGAQDGVYAASPVALFQLSLADDQWQELTAPTLSATDSIAQLVLIQGQSSEVQLLVGTALGEIWRLGDAGWQSLDPAWRAVQLLAIFNTSDKDGVTRLHALTAAENAAQNFVVELWSYDEAKKQDRWLSLATFESETPAVLPLVDGRSIFLATQNRLIKLFYSSVSSELAVTQHFFNREERITALATSAEEGSIYVATTTALHVLADGGVTWREMGDLPSAQPIVSILPGEGDAKLKVVSLGGAVWATDMD